MKVQQRGAAAVLCVLVWVVWGCFAWHSYDFAADVTEHVAYTLTGGVIVAWLVSPIIATARIWYDIGRLEQAKDCGRDGHSARVVELHPHRPHS